LTGRASKLIAIIMVAIVVAAGLGYWALVPRTPVQVVTTTEQTLLTTSSTGSTASTTVTETTQWITISASQAVTYYLELLELNGTQPYVQLATELRKLPDATDATAVAKITYLALGATNPEVKEAFELMMKGGTPSPGDFAYTVPKYNTELEILYWLACQNEFKKDDTLALAIAMAHGVWLTIGTAQVQEAAKRDVTGLLVFFRETNEFQKQKHAPLLSAYPIEALLCLVWTAGQNLNNGPHGLFSSNPYFRDRPSKRISLTDYEWDVLSVEGLREARNMVRSNSWDGVDYVRVFSQIESQFSAGGPHWIGGWDSYKTHETMKIDGEAVPIHNINNPDFEIDYYRETGKGIGVCDDQAIIVEALAKSWGIATTTMYRMWGGEEGVGHTHAMYFDPVRNAWYGSSGQLAINRYRTDLSNHVSLYLTKPPWYQTHLLRWRADPFVPSYHMSNIYYASFTMTAQQVLDLFSAGIKSAVMKQWLLYS